MRPAKTDQTVTAPTAVSGLTYTGSAQTLVSAAVVTTGNTAAGSITYSLDNSTYSTDLPTGTDVGTYNVYYKVAGNDSYNEFVGASPVSVSIEKATPTVTAPTATNPTYTGSAQTLVSAAVVTTGNTAAGSITYSLDNSTYSTDLPTGTDVGTYNVYYKVAGNDSYNEFVGASPVSVSIEKATPTVTAPTATNPTYTGSAQNLITAGTTTGGEIQYSTDGSSYSTSIPQGTEKATYTVYYKVVGNGNYNDVAAQTVTSTISDKTPATITTAPTAKTLTYTGSAQALVTAGVANGGTMQYSLDGTDYSTTIPTGTAAGNYTVYYKAVGDASHSDSAAASVTVTISAAVAQNTTNNTESTSTENTSTDSEDDNENDTEYYSEVSIYTGEVKDITGTTEATRETNPYSTVIVNSNNLGSLLNITAEEKAAGVNVWLDVKDASTTVPAADKTAIQNAARGYTVGVYLDISLFKKVGSGNPAKVTDTNGKVKVSIVIPENLRTAGRTFEVIRVHNGVSTVIQGTYDAANYTFTFETDQFSSYAIAYKDSTTSPKTGETNDLRVWYLLLLAGVFGAAGAIVAAKKKNKASVSGN